MLAIVVFGAAVLLVSTQIQNQGAVYNSSIEYKLSKQTESYDYSCNEPLFPIYLQLSNNGSKVVEDLSISITNGLCKGAVPPLPSSMNPGQSLQIYLYTTKQNGTITISGNYTTIYVDF